MKKKTKTPTVVSKTDKKTDNSTIRQERRNALWRPLVSFVRLK